MKGFSAMQTVLAWFEEATP